ncbi:hypothetical protein N0V90_002486 [Kalmusia sp. IMI 367209]|nr:hypothetical protein N0V90_002486 [Kalmusia sp. IMI 367209]
MDTSFEQLDGRTFHDFQRTFGLSGNSYELFVQQQIGRQEAMSPGQPRSRGSSYSGSPTSPTAAHRPVSQPSTAQLQPGYYATGPTSMLQSTTSPVSSTYEHPVSDSIGSSFGYNYDPGFGDMPLHDASGMMRTRNNSEKLMPDGTASPSWIHTLTTAVD